VSAAIESILNQSFTNFELIIINDASSDHSLRIIERYNDPRIQVINFAKRKGLVQSLNYALDEAGGGYIARQDADDFSLPTRFESQLRYFHDHPQTALLGTSVRCIDEHGKAVEERIALPTPPRYFSSSPFVHGSVMVKKSVIAEVGGYNELFSFVEDYELWLRIASKHRVNNLTDVLYLWRLHPDSITVTKAVEQYLLLLLVQKMAKHEISAEIVNEVRAEGICKLYNHLTKEEKVAFHKLRSRSYIRQKNLDLARKEYVTVSKLKRTDCRNYLLLLASLFGCNPTLHIYRFYNRLTKNPYFRRRYLS
jgi:glycosyltransferase involved in cell wall biosynthesis